MMECSMRAEDFCFARSATNSGHARRSETGHSRPKWDFRATSAFLLIATEGSTSRDVPNVPRRDSCTALTLLDHLVGARKYQRRDGDAERLCSLEVDDQLVFCWMLAGEIGGGGR